MGPVDVSLGTVIAAYAGLAAVGTLSWRRTRPLPRPNPHGIARLGRGPPPVSSPPAFASTSRTTYLAGAAGLAVMALGMAVTATGHVRGAVAVATAGAFVAVAGFRSRVAGLGVGTEGLLIRYAHRPAIMLPWTELVRLSGPRTPLGGWRLDGTAGRVTLMPSDLLGHEWLVTVAIERAQLSRDGRRGWRRPPAPLR
jgi:hypothetical protein